MGGERFAGPVSASILAAVAETIRASLGIEGRAQGHKCGDRGYELDKKCLRSFRVRPPGKTGTEYPQLLCLTHGVHSRASPGSRVRVAPTLASPRPFPLPWRYQVVLQRGTTLGKDFLHVAFAVDNPQHQYFFGCHEAIENDIRAQGKAAVTRPDFIALPA